RPAWSRSAWTGRSWTSAGCVRASPPPMPAPPAHWRATSRPCCARWKTPRTPWCASPAPGPRMRTCRTPPTTAPAPRNWRTCASRLARPICSKCSTPSAPACRRRTRLPRPAPAAWSARSRCTRRWRAVGPTGCRNEEKPASDRGLFPGKPTVGRLYTGLRKAGLLHDFGGEVVGLLLDAFAHGQAHERHDLGAAGGLQRGLDGLVGVEHVRLPGEADLGQGLGDLAGADLLQDFGRLARILDLGQRDFLLAGDEVGRDGGGRNVGRVHRGDVHRQAAGQLLVAALDLDQHADAAAVHVGADV